MVLLFTAFPVCDVYACNYSERNKTLYCVRDEGCNDEALEYAENIIIDTKLTRTGIDRLKRNENLRSLQVNDVSNLTEEDLMTLYPFLAKGNIALASVLFAYGDYYASFGNDGTALYKRVCRQLCPSVSTLRSCATVVAAALNAAGVSGYDTAATAGLIDLFEDSAESGNWICLGQVSENKLRAGDIIFIDRRSHAAQYESGEIVDDEYKAEEEYVYTGGYDTTGHKNYETQDPTGNSHEVFCPDQDGDGEVGEWEAEYWKCYWERVNADTLYVPPYDYYYVWKDEAEEQERKEAEEKKAREEKKKVVVKKPTKVIHDHIFVWTGNDVIRQYFSGSSGNIISGSYTENYQNARSAALSKYNFTGDYRAYRYIGPIDRRVSVSSNDIIKWKENTAAQIAALREANAEKKAEEEAYNEELRLMTISANDIAAEEAQKLHEERKKADRKRQQAKERAEREALNLELSLKVIRGQSLKRSIIEGYGRMKKERLFTTGKLM